MDSLAYSGAVPEKLTARKAGLVACTICGKLAYPGGNCTRCNTELHSRAPLSLQKTMAWLSAGIILYIPANLYPMLVTSSLGTEDKSTIIGGVITLAAHHMWFIAAVVGIASVLIPMAKFLILGTLVLSIKYHWPLNPHQRLRLYEATEFIGRWSMIDVFVVAILSALVQLGFVATIHPGIAAICFACSVIFTMLAAQNLDPRLIWDDEDEKPA